MLHLYFLNDGSGNEIKGNYKWGIFINKELIAHGDLKGHKRLEGWQGLIKKFTRKECKCLVSSRKTRKTRKKNIEPGRM
jgi:hypothetical protein